ncbi:MAG TPA: glycosyltransferase family 4 protein [Candidatus Limnocylindria bacterium]|nr:glycosyltransferase family 4 protein [Candidatus Limnocylindria bacterium]
MKIGIVTQSYYPRYGGVTEHVHHTAQELRRRGHDVTIITSHFRRGEARHVAGVERIGYNLLIPFNGAFVDLAVGFRLRQQLRALFKAHEFEIVHTHAPLVPTLPLLAIRTATCAQVGTFHTTGGRSRLLELARGYLAPVVERLDARIAVSHTARDFVAGYFPGEYHIVPNGVDIERFHPGVTPFEEWSDPEFVNLLFVGRLDPRKGAHDLIAAMPEVVARTRGRARLLIVGDSYLRPKLEASVAREVRAHVHFLGHVPSHDLPRWYATGDVFVSPASGNESFGIVLLEAMASGRAVVASDIPGYRSVVNPGENAVVFPPGDVTALAATLAALVADPARRRALGERGRTHALEFSWPKVTDRIEGLYRDILARRGRLHSAA